MTEARGSVKVWIDASRPKTLWAAFAPVFIGLGLAYRDGLFDLTTALVTLGAAMAIQVGTNFWNDYADFLKGADTAERVGPTRATAAGLVSPAAMRNAALAAFGVAGLAAVVLFPHAGWPILVVGAASILSGIAYTSGPFPLAYTGLADLFALVFFGPVAVAGTYYVQALAVPDYVLIAGLAPGFLSVAVLTVNNLRDIETDAKANKRTLAVRFGRSFARTEYVACIAAAAFIPFWAVRAAEGKGVNAIAAMLILPAAIPGIRSVMTKSGRDLNGTLAITAMLLLVYSVLFTLGWNQ